MAGTVPPKLAVCFLACLCVSLHRLLILLAITRTAIASLILDPYYRTYNGFLAMIEKDWLCFGHKFSDRCGHIGGDTKEMAPVFTQFLEVIWQIMQQHPCAFEFNERFLITINDSVHNVQFGTFVGNCEKERAKLRFVARLYHFQAAIQLTPPPPLYYCQIGRADVLLVGLFERSPN